MGDENTPPWDTSKQPENHIDRVHVFMPPPSIFGFGDQSDQSLTKTINSSDLSDTKQNMPEATTQTQITIKNPKTSYSQSQNQPITLALKYRPKTFSELVGQESVARTLCLAFDSKKISNAYLFSGLHGSGKTSSARILARCLQCEVDITPNPCGKCPNCIAALKGSHLDIIELDGASNRKIDDIRELIEQTKYKPTIGRFKVFIIDEVHMLTKEAFNSLLKTLEEPPSYIKFILATTDPLKVPSTILSRAQHFRFKKIPVSAIKNHLSYVLKNENVITDEHSIDMIIRNGHGSMRDTLTLLDQAIVFCQNKITTKKLAEMLGSLDPKAFDGLFQALLRKNMQECVQFVRSLEGYEAAMVLDELSLYIKDKMLEEVPQIPPILGMRYANIINDSKAMLQLDCDGEFCLLLTILKMLEAQKIREVEHAIKQLEETQTSDMRMQISTLAQDYINKQNNTHIHNNKPESSPSKIDANNKDSMNDTDMTMLSLDKMQQVPKEEQTEHANIQNVTSESGFDSGLLLRMCGGR